MELEFPWCHDSVEVIYRCVMCGGPVWPYPYYICGTCHWEDDPWACDFPEDPYNTNGVSFTEALENWNNHRNIWGDDERFTKIMALLREED